MNDFIERITALYTDFARRIDALNWEELLDEELNLNLTAEVEVSEQLLDFLLQQSSLPLEVWQVFEDKFGWSSQKEELQASYPPAFIEYVIKQITENFDNDIKFHLFDPNMEKDFDRFIFLFREVAHYLDYRTLQGVQDLVEELENFGIDHPDYLLEKARILAVQGNPDEGLELLHYIFDTYTVEYEASTYFKFVHAFVLATFTETDKLEEAIFLFEELLEVSPNDVTSRDGLADCYERIGDLDKAYQITMDHILAGLPSDNYALQRLQLLSQKLIPIYQEKYETGEASEEDILELAKYYRQTRKNDEAFELLQDNPQLDHLAKYNRLIANLYAVQCDSDNAISYAQQSIKIEPSIFAYDTLVNALIATRHFEAAFAAINEGEKLTAVGYDRVGKALLLDAKARSFYLMNEYDNALAASDEALRIHDRVAHLYNTRAEILLRMNNLEEAMNNAIISQNLLPLSIRPYEIQAEIYYLAYRIDEVLDVIKQAGQFQLPIVDKLAFYYALTLRDKALSENTSLQPVINLLLELEQSETFSQLDENRPEENLFAKLLSQIAYTYWYKKEDDNALQYILRALDEANEYTSEDVVANWYDFQVGILEVLEKRTEALAVCMGALELFPHNLQLLKRAGSLHSINKNHKEALQLFEQAYEIDQKDEIINDWLEYTYRSLNNNEKALEISRQWTAATGSVNAYRTLALHYKLIKEPDQQLQTLQTALIQHPNNETLLTDLAFHFSNQRAFREAIELCEEVLKLNPNISNVRINLAYNLTCLGQHDAALAVIDIGLEQAPNKVAYYARRGMIFQDAKKPAAAITEYETAIGKIPQDSDNYWTEAELVSRIGTVYFTMLNDGKNALACRQQSVKLKPDDDYYLELLGIAYEFYQKNNHKALEYYLRAAKLNETVYAVLAVGEVKEKLGAEAEARSYYEKAFSLHEITSVSDHSDYTMQARILVRLGDFDEALKYLEQAEVIMRTDGRNSCGACACVYRIYAMYYLKLEQLDEALKAVNKALELENSITCHGLKEEILGKVDEKLHFKQK